MTMKLCFVRRYRRSEAGEAYFTTAPLATQGGDDWDDSPYQYNAGRPFPSRGQEIKVVEFVAPTLFTPADAGEEYSVGDINAGAAPWLIGGATAIHAGASVDAFVQGITSAGGQIVGQEPDRTWYAVAYHGTSGLDSFGYAETICEADGPPPREDHTTTVVGPTTRQDAVSLCAQWNEQFDQYRERAQNV